VKEYVKIGLVEISSKMTLANNVRICTCSFKRFLRRSHLGQITIKQINNDKRPKDCRSFYGHFDFSIQRNFWMKLFYNMLQYIYNWPNTSWTCFVLISTEYLWIFLKCANFSFLSWRMVIISKYTKLCLTILGFNFFYHKLQFFFGMSCTLHLVCMW
jgi:hypothetical protein